MTDQAQEIIDFWFGPTETLHERISERGKFWYMRNPETDLKINSKFCSIHKEASEGNLSDWENEPESCLALVILLDQFSRNLYRNSPDAFSNDNKTNKIVKNAISKNFPEKLHPICESFYYVPLMHMENMDDQNLCVDLGGRRIIKKEINNEPESIQNFLKGCWEYAIKHREVIEKFGRFPHRNEALSRVSTSEEKEYLSQPGAGF
jgi:uncharacterized protein (DUF924 family)